MRLRDLSMKDYAEHVDKWIDAGATIIGGCCRISRSYLAFLKSYLQDMATSYKS